jgi:hypothetical protein
MPSWLVEQLEERVSGNNVEIKPCGTYTMAESLDEMTENMMLARQMFFSRLTKKELRLYETYSQGRVAGSEDI